MQFELVLDNGNYEIKAVSGQSFIRYIHKVAPINKFEYEEGLQRYPKQRHLDFVCIRGLKEDRSDDSYFVVGETAQYYSIQRRQGATRYDRAYYGVLFASTVARLNAVLGKRSKTGKFTDLKREGMKVIASHASRDYPFRKNLKASLEGNWHFECGGMEFEFKVNQVDTYEEPFGGYAKRAFVKHEGKWKTPLARLKTAIIDIGGGTTGTLIVAADGAVEYGAAASADQGVNGAVERLRNSLKSAYPEWMAVARDIPMDVLQHAIRTGEFIANGRSYGVQDYVDAALNPLLNEVKTMWMEKLDGGFGIHRAVLTGGGNILLGENVKQMLDFDPDSIMYAADEAEIMPFANVLGAKQFFELLDEA